MESRRTLLGTAAVAGGLIVAPSVVSATPPSIGAQTISSAAELRIAATPAGLRSARVDVFAFPTPRSTQPDYKMRKVGQARVTDSGIIRFPSVPSSRLRRFALGTGIVNLEAFAYAGRRTASWSYSVAVSRSQGRVSIAPDPTDLAPPGHGEVEAAAWSEAGAHTLRLKPTRRAALPPIRRAELPPNPGSAPSTSWGCGQTRKTDDYLPWVKMAIARSDTRRVTAQLMLEDGVESELGVATRLAGGGYQFAGRSTLSSDWQTEFRRVANRAVQYETTCPRDNGSQSIEHARWSGPMAFNSHPCPTSAST